MNSELDFEMELIHHLESIGGSKQWSYESNIKTFDQLWDNFKRILERNNAGKLDGRPLTEGEFAQVKSVINNLQSPYDAGRWIYGLNGVTQVEIDRDETAEGAGGEHVFLTVFDQDQVGAGNTEYQIVNQIEVPHALSGRKDRRFDTTLLINGLPLIQIEEKFEGHSAEESLRQMRQYIDEHLYTDIYSTVQLLVGITPYQALYMANTDADSFNLDFAFHWQREEDSQPVYEWREFANLMLSIPMAHQMSTNYIILDGDPRHKNLIVMRPYQVYATKRVINRLRNHVYGTDRQEIGYIWHTTGSGKTISSFKTAWLASRLPNVDKVIFVVDRVALTKQTFDKYIAYDPDTDEDNHSGVVSDTAHTGILAEKINSKAHGNSIIVTSIQKLERLVRRESFHAPDKNIVFIVDEAHRSTNGQMLLDIKQAFPASAWVGYTGTPAFDGDLTYKAFGDLVHAYTIREAIADANVLGFKVDFEHTLPDDEVKENLLPELLKAKYPSWDQGQVDFKIAGMTPNEVDGYIDSRVYDDNARHVENVVKDIIKQWRNRSKEGRYSAILTVHVGGGRPSAPMALMYFKEFQKQNEKFVTSGKQPLNVAVTFSQATDNGETQLEKNRGLRVAMDKYNYTFGTNYDDTTVSDYFNDVASRLRGEFDGPKLDLVIVINQLLTGYDAKMVNTLYVDRTLSGASLIQAYSRTNRIDNHQDKPFGRIVNYRWPETSKKLMDEALSVYANRDSSMVQTSFESLEEGGIVAPDYDKVITEVKTVLNEISDLTDEYQRLPPGEHEKQQLIHLIGQYNSKISVLKQDTNYDYDHPEQLLNELNINSDDEKWLTTTARYELKRWVEARHELDLSALDYRVEHISEVKVDYDYIADLLAQLINDVHENKETVEETYHAFTRAVDQLEDRRQAEHLKDTASSVMRGENVVEPTDYPVTGRDISRIVRDHVTNGRRQEILSFKRKWGIVDVATANSLITAMLDRHIMHHDDLNTGEELTRLINQAVEYYSSDSDDPSVKKLSRIRYRNRFREAFGDFADYVVSRF